MPRKVRPLAERKLFARPPREGEERLRPGRGCEKGMQVFRCVLSVRVPARRSKNFVIQPMSLVGVLAKILNDP